MTEAALAGLAGAVKGRVVAKNTRARRWEGLRQAHVCIKHSSRARIS